MSLIVTERARRGLSERNERPYPTLEVAQAAVNILIHENRQAFWAVAVDESGMTLQRYLTRLIALCALPVLLLAVVLAFSLLWDWRRDDRRDAERRTGATAAAIDQMLMAREAGLQILAASPDGDSPERWPLLRRTAEGFQTTFGGHVALVDPSLQLRLHTAIEPGAALPEVMSPESLSVIRQALSSLSPAVGAPFLGPVVGEAVVALVVPALRGGRAGFVLSTGIPVKRIEQHLQDHAPEGWRAEVRTSEGRVVARIGPEADAGTGEAPEAGRFSQPLAKAPWRVDLIAPGALNAERDFRLAGNMILVLLGAAAVAVLGGAWASRPLAAAVGSLGDVKPTGKSGRGKSGFTAGIAEVVAARRLLDQSIDDLERAHQERSVSDERHRLQLEQSARALQAREAHLRGIFDTATEAIVTADEQQRIVMVNPAATAMFGMAADRMTGLELAELMPQRFRERHRKDVDDFGRRELGARMMGRRSAVEGLRSNGEIFPIEASISHFKADGSTFYTVMLRDITERRHAESALFSSRATLQTAMDSMNDALLVVDAQRQLINYNEAFARFHRFADKAAFAQHESSFPASLEHLDLDGLPVPDERLPHVKALRGESGTGFVMKLRRRDTGESWMGSYSFAPIRDSGAAVVGGVVTVRDITREEAMRAELHASQLDLRRLVAGQQSVQEEERKRIARELHDDLQQTLAAIRMDIGEIEHLARRSPADLRMLVAGLDTMAAAAVVSTRRIVNDLRPALLEELGLPAALEAMGTQFEARTGISTTVVCDLGAVGPIGDHAASGEPPGGPGPEPGEDIEPSSALCLYRIAQESLNNVAKHAGASHVVVHLTQSPQGALHLCVEDDGRGLDPGDLEKPMSFGIKGMAERVRALGGGLVVEDEAGQGVRLCVDLPAGAAARR